MNKKFILSMIVVIILGIVSAKTVYSLSEKIEDKYSYYFLQLGVYDDIDSLNDDTKNIDDKLVLKENGKYSVYVGISKEKDNLTKISNLYKNYGYNLIIKSKRIDNEEFILNLEQFDKLLKQTTDLEELKKVMAVILSSYQEMVINSII